MKLSQQLKKIEEEFDKEFPMTEFCFVETTPIQIKKFIRQAIKKVVKEILEEVVPRRKGVAEPISFDDLDNGFNDCIDEIHQNIKEYKDLK